MVRYIYDHQFAFDPNTKDIARNVTGQVYRVSEGDNLEQATPLPTYDLNGIPNTLTSNNIGALPDFQVDDNVDVLWVSGEFVFHLKTTTPLVGPAGPAVSSARDNGDNTVTFLLENGTEAATVSIPEGPVGPSVQLGIGTVEHGATASATVTGEGPGQQLNLVLPAGKDGSNVLPTQDAILQEFQDPASPVAIELTATTASQIQVEVPPLAEQVAADYVASQPAVLDAAAAAAGPAVGAALATNPLLPRQKTFEQDDYLTATVSPAGKLLAGARKDGSYDIPVARVAGSVTRNVANGEFFKATVSPAGKVFEDALGVDGSVPQWVLDRWASRMGTSYSGQPYDIVVIGGQSNATQADTLTVTTEETDPRLYRWNATSAVIEPLTGWNAHLGADFARNYVRNQPPGRRVLIVETAIGSTGFSSTSIQPAPSGYHYRSGGTWDRALTSDPNNLYTRMIARANAAKTAAGTGARFVAFLWSQGEDDRVNGDDSSAPMTRTQYEAKLDDLVATTRTDLGAPDLPVLIGSMTPETIWDAGPGTATEGIHFAHVDAPRRIQRSAFIWGPANLHKYNEFRIHWSAQGQRERGRMFYDAMYRAKLNLAGEKPLPPQHLTVNRSGDRVEVAWEHPPTRATAFTVEHSINGGAWTPVALPVAVATEAAFTVPAASPIKVRARTTNEVGTSDNTREVNA